MLGAMVVAGTLIPLVVVVMSGASLVGMTEESTGYRYFHTLRLLYGDNERPWLPQGQLPGLFYLAIQIALTAAGHAPEELFPRIDRWAYMAASLPHLLSLLAYCWAARALEGWLERLLLAAGMLVIAFNAQAGGGSHAIQPDYQFWAIPCALTMLGGLLRLGQGTLRAALWVGLFAGVCLAIKPTYPFALPLAALLVLRAGSLAQRVRVVLAAGAVALLTAGLAVWAYYVGDLTATTRHASVLREFVQVHASTESFWTWWWRSATAPTIGALACWLPLVLIVTAFVPGRRQISLALLVGLVAMLWIVSGRDTSVTWQETQAFALASIAALHPVRIRWTPGLRGVQVVGVALTLGVMYWTGTFLRDFSAGLLWTSDQTMKMTAGIDAFIANEPDGTHVAIVAPDNGARLMTVHTAIVKGVGDFSTPMGEPIPVSDWLRSRYPNFVYIWMAPEKLLVPTSSYRRVVFALPTGRTPSEYSGWLCEVLDTGPQRIQNIILCHVQS